MDKQQKITILEAKLIQLKGSLYDAEIDVRIATKIEDEQLKESAIDRMKKMEKAIDELEKIVVEINEEE